MSVIWRQLLNICKIHFTKERMLQVGYVDYISSSEPIQEEFWVLMLLLHKSLPTAAHISTSVTPVSFCKGHWHTTAAMGKHSPCPKGKCGRCYWNVVFLLTCNQTRYQGSTDGEAEGSDAHCDLVANAESKTSVSPLTVAGSNVQPVDVSAPSGPCAQTSCQNLTSQSLFSTLHAAAVGCFKRAEQKPTTRLCCTVIHSCVSWENQITSSMIQHGLDLIHEILWRTTLHWALCVVFPQAYFQLGVQTGVSPCLYVKDFGIKFIFFSLPCCNSIQSFPKTPGKEAFSQPSSPLYTALKIMDQIQDWNLTWFICEGLQAFCIYENSIQDTLQ